MFWTFQTSSQIVTLTNMKKNPKTTSFGRCTEALEGHFFSSVTSRQSLHFISLLSERTGAWWETEEATYHFTVDRRRDREAVMEQALVEGPHISRKIVLKRTGGEPVENRWRTESRRRGVKKHEQEESRLNQKHFEKVASFNQPSENVLPQKVLEIFYKIKFSWSHETLFNFKIKRIFI